MVQKQKNQDKSSNNFRKCGKPRRNRSKTRHLGKLSGRKKNGATPSAKRDIPLAKKVPFAQSIEHISIERLKPNSKNPRSNDPAVDAVVRSIQAFGFNSPIITDGDLNIAAGHTRLKAAKLLGLTEVPVIRIPGLVGSRFTGFSIADNKTAEIATWDEDLLNQIIAELNTDIDFDLASLGFNDAELTEILDRDFQDDEEKADNAPPLPKKTATKPGDLWLLDDHRLMCGDATNSDDIQRLVEGQQVDCIITDPPYGVNYHSRGRKKNQWGDIRNDALSLNEMEAFLTKAFANAAKVCRPGATAYICHGISAAGIRIAFEMAFLSAGFHLSSTIIWAKQSASMGWGDYRERHEPILYGWIGEGHRRISDRTQTTLWNIDREADYRHPTQKPVALFSRALRNSTIRGEVVLDPFVGSGTSIITSEQLGRRCMAMEIDPRYCDVTVKRWKLYTGKKARLFRDQKEIKEGIKNV
jgi:site-specific DNA-methyltransferase (adenine-specific)